MRETKLTGLEPPHRPQPKMPQAPNNKFFATICVLCVSAVNFKSGKIHSMNQRSITNGLEIYRRDTEYAEGRRVN